MKYSTTITAPDGVIEVAISLLPSIQAAEQVANAICLDPMLPCDASIDIWKHPEADFYDAVAPIHVKEVRKGKLN